MGRHQENEVKPQIRELMQLCGAESVTELASKLGVSPSTVRSWNKAGRVGATYKKAAAKLAGAASNNEFSEIALDDQVSPAGSSSPSFVLKGAGYAQRFAVVPRFGVRASAGTGSDATGEEQVGEFAFEVGWMRRNLGRAGEGFASVLVRGDSMQPTLINGDEIIIDRHVLRVDVNGIYVISLRGDLLVKRVQRMLDGRLVVRSDNTAYAPEELTAERAEDFRVVGRMVWPRVR